jgi:hypothetical protein
MADYSKYAKLDPATLQALKAAYAKEGLGYGIPQSEASQFDQWIPTSVDGYQINANTIANPNYQVQGADNSDPAPETISGKDIGSFSKQIGDNVYTYNTNGDLTQVMPTGGRWGSTFDMIKFLAPTILGMGFPGAGATLGGALGVGTTAGAALLQAGLAKITGGDPLKAAAFSALMSNAGTQIGDTGYTVGDISKAVKVAQAASSGDLMSAVTGAASMAGGADIKIGDTGYTVGDLMKNGKLLQSVLSGNPQAVIGAISKFANSTQNDVIGGLKSAGLTNGSAPDVKDFITDYFAPGGEGYIAPATGDGSGGTNLVNGYIDETNGHWIDTSSGVEVDTGKAGPLNNNNSGNPASMKDWSVDSKTGQWTWTNPATGEQTVYDYKTPITGPAQTGAQIENKAGAAPATSPAAATPKGGTPTSGTPTTGTPTAATAAAIASRYGLDPLDILKMAGVNDVAHIKSFKELFGHDMFEPDKTPSSSSQDQTDVVEAATGGQVYSGGGDIHALLQLLRS